MHSRRQFLAGSCAATSLLGGTLPRWARTGEPGAAHNEYDLTIGEQRLQIGGRNARAMTIDGSLPGTLLRMREGDTVTLRVRNELDSDSSLHWHGILLPPEMDGVPGISFAGIPPGQTFTYRYRLQQSGTYWYHSHSGLQEQSGVYAPLIVDPAGPEPADYGTRTGAGAVRLDLRKPGTGVCTAQKERRLLQPQPAVADGNLPCE